VNNEKSMAGIQALLFDLGGVVLEIDFERAFTAWAGFAGVGMPELREQFRFDEEYRQHERGELEGAGYFEHLGRLLNIKLPNEQWLHGWNRILMSPIAGVLPLLTELGKRLPIFMFSNTNALHVQCLRLNYHELFKPFRKVFVSSQLGMRKPETVAFLRVASLMKVPAQSILFFDDLAENVAGARISGMSAVQVASIDDIRRGLREHDIL
jgi:glucose-1-phosphatase